MEGSGSEYTWNEYAGDSTRYQVLGTRYCLFLSFLDVHDFVLENEQIGFALTGQAHHVLVVVLNPATHNFAVSQLDADRLLLLTKRLKVIRLSEGLFGRHWARATIGVLGSVKRHALILHGAR